MIYRTGSLYPVIVTVLLLFGGCGTAPKQAANLPAATGAAASPSLIPSQSTLSSALQPSSWNALPDWIEEDLSPA